LLVFAAFWVSFASSWSGARPADDPFDGAPSSGSAAWSTACQYKTAAHIGTECGAEYKPEYQADAQASAPSRARARDENSRLGFLAENARFCVPRACANHETASGSEVAAGKIASGRIVHNYFVGGLGVLVHNATQCAPTALDVVSTGKDEFTIVRYGDRSPGFENHHGIMDKWAVENIPGYVSRAPDGPSIRLSSANHNQTRMVFTDFTKGWTGRPVAALPWDGISPRTMQSLAESMFDSANVPEAARAAYYREFMKYIYTGEW
jgi:hypothetical protein